MATVAHTFVALNEEQQKKKLKDDAANSSSLSITAIVVIGRTGAGKSSLINLFCSSAKVGHTTKSQTIKSNLFNENQQRYWLDTQGASDSNGIADDKVLCDVLKELYNNNITKIKIIWCVSGDTQSRASEEFQKQARFIKNSLGDTNNEIWKSCLIIKKQGQPKPSGGLDGLLKAASISGSDINYGNNRLFGYSFYDPNVALADHTLTMALKYITDPTQKNDFLKSAGFWSKDDIQKELNKLLSTLPTSSIEFSLLKCSKCGVMGDPRFVYAPCHTKKEKYHPDNVTSYHSGSIIKYHPIPSPQYYHPKTVVEYHSGNLDSPRYYHSGSTTSSYYYHPSGSSYNWFAFRFRWKHNCCNKYVYDDNNNKRDNGCKYKPSKYTCCGSSSSSSGCCSYMVYSCCGGSDGSRGCKIGYECCYASPTDRGCKQKYVCCNKPTTDKGCKEKYSCCNAPSKHKGCKMKYPCCDKASGKEGCIERCSNASCHVKWGNGPGCIETSSPK